VYGPLLEELYANAAAFVLPSALEGLPLTLLEAISYGTPVVASRIPPHVEVLCNGNGGGNGGNGGPGGRLFPSGDEIGLSETLARVLREPATECRGADHLRESVLRRYSWATTLAATMSVYEEVLGSHERVPAPAYADAAAATRGLESTEHDR
jgi:glycosyltransferase involved in cell wall biosynthesis